MARYISANVIDGCFEVDPLEFDCIQVYRPRDFIDELPRLEGDDQIYTVFDISDNDAWNEFLKNYRVDLLLLPSVTGLFDLMSDPAWVPDLDIVIVDIVK